MKKIIVIDDDLVIRQAFCLALEDMPYIIDTAESGEQGLEMVRDGGYDLIFLDLKMPGISGVETLQAIRKTDMNVPVYIITAFHQEFFVQLKKASEEGIDFHLLKKPVGMGDIKMVTRSVLDDHIVTVDKRRKVDEPQ